MALMTDYENIIVTEEGWRQDIIFKRPDKRNALTHKMMKEIGDAIRSAAENQEVRAVLLRGSGRNFCAGGDLDFMSEMPVLSGAGNLDPLVGLYRLFGDVLKELNELPKIVVAIVEGAAVGGGLGMACCADIVITRDSAKFGMPEPKAGFIPSQIIPYVVRRIGEGWARRLALTGIIIDGNEAKELGIAHHCCFSDDELEGQLQVVLNEINQVEPTAVSKVKKLVLKSAIASDAKICDEAAEDLVELLRGREAALGLKSFKEKRAPPWVK